MHYREENDSFVLETFPVGKFQVNTSIIYNKKSLEGIIIDPGNSHAEVKSFLAKKKVKLECALHTHGHADHIGRSSDLNIPLYLHMDDGLFYSAATTWGEHYNEPTSKKLREIDYYYVDNYLIQFEGLKMTILFTPGHSPGSVGIYLEAFEHPVLFSGDTLFFENIGRSDLEQSDSEALLKSIKERFYTLPDETLVIPGHMQSTTIGHEKRHNPYTKF